MVDTIKCDHCGAEAHHVITREFDGKLMNFCCRGCLGVYEMLRAEAQAQQDNQQTPSSESPPQPRAS